MSYNILTIYRDITKEMFLKFGFKYLATGGPPPPGIEFNIGPVQQWRHEDNTSL